MNLNEKDILSYDVAGFQLITSRHKNRMTTRVITLCRVHATSLTRSVPAMRFLIVHFERGKSHFKWSTESYTRGPFI